MKRYDVQSIELLVAPDRAFAFIADARELPNWTHAFAEVDGQRARLRTAAGEIGIELRVAANAAVRTVDWYMTFPDGSEGSAFSRVVPLGANRCVYSFTLTPPPVSLE
ncbi:MAG: SRPBCC family protein, partial [Longimicrobiales bacterium]